MRDPQVTMGFKQWSALMFDDLEVPPIFGLHMYFVFPLFPINIMVISWCPATRQLRQVLVVGTAGAKQCIWCPQQGAREYPEETRRWRVQGQKRWWMVVKSLDNHRKIVVLWDFDGIYLLVIKHCNEKSSGNRGFHRKINDTCSIFHCHVWIPDGICVMLMKMFCRYQWRRVLTSKNVGDRSLHWFCFFGKCRRLYCLYDMYLELSEYMLGILDHETWQLQLIITMIGTFSTLLNWPWVKLVQ